MKAILVISLILNFVFVELLRKAKQESRGWEMLANHTATELEMVERKVYESNISN